MGETQVQQLRRCAACRVVYYCSTACQRRDRKAHAPFCDAIKKAWAAAKLPAAARAVTQGAEEGEAEASALERYRAYLQCMMREMERGMRQKKMKSKPMEEGQVDARHRNVIFFQRVCRRCCAVPVTAAQSAAMHACRRCHSVFWCAEHVPIEGEEEEEHALHTPAECARHLLALQVERRRFGQRNDPRINDQDTGGGLRLPATTARPGLGHLPDGRILPSSWTSFFAMHELDRTSTREERVLWTLDLGLPLTILFALENMPNQIPDLQRRQALCLHILGPRIDVDVSPLGKYFELFRLLPQLRLLALVMVGPEIPKHLEGVQEVDVPADLIGRPGCLITVSYAKMLYHEYLNPQREAVQMLSKSPHADLLNTVPPADLLPGGDAATTGNGDGEKTNAVAAASRGAGGRRGGGVEGYVPPALVAIEKQQQSADGGNESDAASTEVEAFDDGGVIVGEDSDEEFDDDSDTDVEAAAAEAKEEIESAVADSQLPPLPPQADRLDDILSGPPPPGIDPPKGSAAADPTRAAGATGGDPRADTMPRSVAKEFRAMFCPPDLCVAHNAGLHNGGKDSTWLLTLALLTQLGLPCLFTSYNASECRADVQALLGAAPGNNAAVTMPPMRNPFGGQLPFREIMFPGRWYFHSRGLFCINGPRLPDTATLVPATPEREAVDELATAATSVVDMGADQTYISYVAGEGDEELDSVILMR